MTVSPKGERTKYGTDSLGRAIVTNRQVDAAATQWAGDSTVYDSTDQVIQTARYGPAMNGIVAETLMVKQYYNPEGQRDSVIRTAIPDGAPIGRLKSSWRYDVLGRSWLALTVDSGATSAGDTASFDPAGNTIRVGTRRGDVLTMKYDSLNRLVERKTPTPSKPYPARIDRGIPYLAGKTSSVEWGAYPRYGNNAAHGLTIPADVATFTFDQMGNLTRAINRDADVRRGYDQSGFLIADTLVIRTVKEIIDNGDMTIKHRYVTGYRYDLEGRRTFIAHPDQLSPSPGSGTTLTYDSKFGLLATVSDPLGQQFRYHFNARGDVDSLYMPRGWLETYTYDANGGRVKHVVQDASAGRLRNERVDYDARGNSVLVADSAGVRDTLVTSYTGLGFLRQSKQTVATQDMYGKAGHHTSYQQFTPDAIANQVVTDDSQDDVIYGSGSWPSHWSRQQRYQLNVGRHTATGVRWQDGYDRDRTDTLLYDAAGNIEWSTQSYWTSHASFEDRASYYDAANRVYAADYRSVPDAAMITTSTTAVEYRSTFEEYRYDALGRRVWTRARRYCEKSNFESVECNLSTVRRTVWDGDAELYEIQMPGNNGMVDDTLENDVAPIRRQNDVKYTSTDPSAFFGRVGYSYGLGIDRPLSIVRLAYTDSRGYTYAPFTIVPFWNGRGQAYNGYFAQSGGTLCVDAAAGRCARVAYPNHWTALGQTYVTWAFNGTLIEDKQDKAGTLFRRNRTYDPGTGHFTQEDPIGLAGGANFYGYANGNPVTYSDPFGLISCKSFFALTELCYRILLGANSIVHYLPERDAQAMEKQLEMMKHVRETLEKEGSVSKKTNKSVNERVKSRGARPSSEPDPVPNYAAPKAIRSQLRSGPRQIRVNGKILPGIFILYDLWSTEELYKQMQQDAWDQCVATHECA
jgi:RHS repeat-associated protein